VVASAGVGSVFGEDAVAVILDSDAGYDVSGCFDCDLCGLRRVKMVSSGGELWGDTPASREFSMSSLIRETGSVSTCEEPSERTVSCGSMWIDMTPVVLEMVVQRELWRCGLGNGVVLGCALT
jgi:hypothetical protein